MNPQIDDPEQFAQESQALCELYENAPALHQAGVRVISFDEKTGIQALERKHPTKPMRPGLVERREFEYIRHGTQCLFANFEVATGQVIVPSVRDQRREDDLLAHISETVASEPEAQWIFIVDGLNTHMSESLVRYVAQQCELEEDLGVKGQRGILKSMKTRRAFLEQADHRIRFVYTPKHCSWLNQVELWFSILSRRLLKRGSFLSKEDLKERLLRFIDYFNEVLAKPFRWTYKGRVLQA